MRGAQIGLFLVLMWWLASSTWVFAENWTVAVEKDKEESTWSVDIDSVREERTYVRSWTKIQYKQTQRNEQLRKSFSYVLQSVAVDCDRQTLATTTYIERDSSGNVVGSSTQLPAQWQFNEVAPGSIGMTLTEFICAYAKKSVGQQDKESLAFLNSEEWTQIHRASGSNYYIHSSYRAAIGNEITAFEKISYDVPQSIGGSVFTTLLFELTFHCATGLYSTNNYWAYNIGGKTVFQYEYKDAKAEATPTNGPLSSIALTVCADKTGKQNAKRVESTKTQIATGTAWLSEQGYIVTAFHVVDGHETFRLQTSKMKTIKANLRLVDKTNDIAILVADFPDDRPRGLPIAGNVALGSRVFTLGFPHPDIMGSSAKFTGGEISAVSGMQDDPRLLQMSVPVQSGNSGGPLLNLSGEVVGLVSAKLSAIQVLKATGDLPQNVNYAVKSWYVQGILSGLPATKSAIARTKPGATVEDVVAQVRDSIFLLIAE